MPSHLTEKREAQGWQKVEPTAREARPHDKIAITMETPKKVTSKVTAKD
jgi:hypothetical protein